MPLLTRDQILAANDLPTEDVPVPEWGEGATVRVRALTALEREKWMRTLEGAQKAPETMRAGLVASSCVGDDGIALFTTDDVTALLGKNAEVILRLSARAGALSHLFNEQVDSAVKN